jgi:pimeloyl-ACP methyl ester carboxylesterase
MAVRRRTLTAAALAAAAAGVPLLLSDRAPSDRLPRREFASPWSRFATVDGVEVHHAVEGAPGAPTVLLSHHFYGSVATGRRVMAGLAPDARVVALDRPGFGLTERPLVERDRRNPYTRRAAADLAWGLLDRLGVDEAVLVGSSAGGTHVLEMYDRAPERVRALVLVSPAITGDVGAPPPLRPLLRSPQLRRVGPRLVERIVGEVTRERVTRSWADPTRATEEDIAPYRQLLAVEGWSRGLWEVMTAEAPPDLRALLARIHVPTTVVTGDTDSTIAPRLTARTARAIPTGRLEVIADCGHVPQQERPDELVRLIERSLDEVA